MLVLELNPASSAIRGARCPIRMADVSDGVRDAWCRCRCLGSTCQSVNDTLQPLAKVAFTRNETLTQIMPELLSLSDIQFCNYVASDRIKRTGWNHVFNTVWLNTAAITCVQTYCDIV